MRIMDPRAVTTAEQLLAVDDPGYHRELVRGVLRRVTPPGQQHGVVAMRLGARLAAFVEAKNLGITLAAETGFLLEEDPDTVLAPDVAFVRADRVTDPNDRRYFRGAPDLAVEVASPSTSFSEAKDKALAWLRHGCRMVWSVEPDAETVTVYRAADNVRVLRRGDELSGEDVVPGFAVPVSELFPAVSPPASS